MIQGNLLGEKVVNIEDSSYHILGVVHENPLISLTKEYKETLSEYLKGFQVICEDGISEWIEDSKSFNEIEYFGFNKLKFTDYLFFSNPIFIINLSLKKIKQLFTRKLNK